MVICNTKMAYYASLLENIPICLFGEILGLNVINHLVIGLNQNTRNISVLSKFAERQP